MTFLVDSDWLIDGIRGVSDVNDTLAVRWSQGLAISVIISLGEVFDGAISELEPVTLRQLAGFRAFLAPVEVLGLTAEIMERFARVRSDLRRRGRLIPDLDLLIAATALEHNLILMTRKVRHFERIPGLVLYQE